MRVWLLLLTAAFGAYGGAIPKQADVRKGAKGLPKQDLQPTDQEIIKSSRSSSIWSSSSRTSSTSPSVQPSIVDSLPTPDTPDDLDDDDDDDDDAPLPSSTQRSPSSQSTSTTDSPPSSIDGNSDSLVPSSTRKSSSVKYSSSYPPPSPTTQESDDVYPPSVTPRSSSLRDTSIPYLPSSPNSRISTRAPPPSDSEIPPQRPSSIYIAPSASNTGTSKVIPNKPSASCLKYHPLHPCETDSASEHGGSSLPQQGRSSSPIPQYSSQSKPSNHVPSSGIPTPTRSSQLKSSGTSRLPSSSSTVNSTYDFPFDHQCILWDHTDPSCTKLRRQEALDRFFDNDGTMFHMVYDAHCAWSNDPQCNKWQIDAERKRKIMSYLRDPQCNKDFVDWHEGHPGPWHWSERAFNGWSPGTVDFEDIAIHTKEVGCCGQCEIYGGGMVDVHYWPVKGANTECMNTIGHHELDWEKGLWVTDSRGYPYYNAQSNPWEGQEASMDKADQAGFTALKKDPTPTVDPKHPEITHPPKLRRQIPSRSAQAKGAALAPKGDHVAPKDTPDAVAAGGVEVADVNGFDCTSPSVCVGFSKLFVHDACGGRQSLNQIAEGIDYTVLAFDPGELSTVAKPWWDRNEEEVPASLIHPFNFADLPCPPESVARQAQYKPEPGIPYRPVLYPPEKLSFLLPGWSKCALSQASFVGIDPPRTMVPKGALVPEVTPIPGTLPDTEGGGDGDNEGDPNGVDPLLQPGDVPKDGAPKPTTAPEPNNLNPIYPGNKAGNGAKPADKGNKGSSGIESDVISKPVTHKDPADELVPEGGDPQSNGAQQVAAAAAPEPQAPAVAQKSEPQKDNGGIAGVPNFDGQPAAAAAVANPADANPKANSAGTAQGKGSNGSPASGPQQGQGEPISGQPAQNAGAAQDPGKQPSVGGSSQGSKPIEDPSNVSKQDMERLNGALQPGSGQPAQNGGVPKGAGQQAGVGNNPQGSQRIEDPSNVSKEDMNKLNGALQSGSGSNNPQYHTGPSANGQASGASQDGNSGSDGKGSTFIPYPGQGENDKQDGEPAKGQTAKTMPGSDPSKPGSPNGSSPLVRPGDIPNNQATEDGGGHQDTTNSPGSSNSPSSQNSNINSPSSNDKPNDSNNNSNNNNAPSEPSPLYKPLTLLSSIPAIPLPNSALSIFGTTLTPNSSPLTPPSPANQPPLTLGPSALTIGSTTIPLSSLYRAAPPPLPTTIAGQPVIPLPNSAVSVAGTTLTPLGPAVTAANGVVISLSPSSLLLGGSGVALSALNLQVPEPTGRPGSGSGSGSGFLGV